MTSLLHERPEPVEGDLAVSWIHGASRRRRSIDPPLQVHWYDRHTAILRQSKAVSHEAPFIYLLFGNDRAVLFDTGATAEPEAFPVGATVDRLVERWCEDNGRAHYELVVAHTHGHGDHVAGDGQFADRDSTTIVSRDLESVISFFGFSGWPDQVVTLELGGRRLEVTGTPGHHRTAVTVYDPWTGFLLTGDTVYPGRLYVPEFPAFVDSVERMCRIAEARPVSHVMGCHIEMAGAPGRDYPIGAIFQPNEPALQMTVGQLMAVREAAHEVAKRPGVHRYDDFIIYNGPCRRQLVVQAARLLASRAFVRR